VSRDWRFYFRVEGDAYILLDIMPHPKYHAIGAVFSFARLCFPFIDPSSLRTTLEAITLTPYYSERPKLHPLSRQGHRQRQGWQKNLDTHWRSLDQQERQGFQRDVGLSSPWRRRNRDAVV
jgi:hypothetical protein